MKAREDSPDSTRCDNDAPARAKNNKYPINELDLTTNGDEKLESESSNENKNKINSLRVDSDKSRFEEAVLIFSLVPISFSLTTHSSETF